MSLAHTTAGRVAGGDGGGCHGLQMEDRTGQDRKSGVREVQGNEGKRNERKRNGVKEMEERGNESSVQESWERNQNLTYLPEKKNGLSKSKL